MKSACIAAPISGTGPPFRFELLLCMAVGAGLVSATGAAALTYRVPSELPTIQAGIDAATHGDTVLVAPGTYTGPGNRDIKFKGKRIVVRSEAGAEATIVDCQGSESEPHRGFDFYGFSETNESVLDGFTIKNGHLEWNGEPLSNAGGGIRVAGPSSPVIQNCIVTECYGMGGAAVYSQSGATLRQCLFVGNVGTYAADITGVDVFEKCVIAQNSGHGMYLGGDLIEIVETTIAGNGGIGVKMEVAYLITMRDCLIYGNDGIGIRASDTDEVLIEGCTIAANKPPSGQAGVRIAFNNYAMLIRRSVIWGNCYADLITSGTAQVTLECCAIDPSRVSGTGDLTYSGPQVTQDPMFCAPQPCQNAPTTEGDYHLQAGSPCLPENSPCGEQIGALGEGCSPSSVPGSDRDGTPAGGSSPARLVVQVSPNPTRGVAWVHLAPASGDAANEVSVERAALDTESIELSVFDVSGRERLRESRQLGSGGGGLELDTSALDPGPYFVRVRAAGGEGTGRLLVVR